jgi:hypothetical protein
MEVDMRLFLIAAAAAAMSLSGFPGFVAMPAASAAECTGANCPPPSGQGGGHDCERKKQEQTTS